MASDNHTRQIVVNCSGSHQHIAAIVSVELLLVLCM